MDHAVAQLANGEPFVRRVDQLQALGAIQVFEHRGGGLLHESEKCRQELVADRILQPPEARNEGIDALAQVVVLRQSADRIEAEWLRKKSIIRAL